MVSKKPIDYLNICTNKITVSHKYNNMMQSNLKDYFIKIFILSFLLNNNNKKDPNSSVDVSWNLMVDR